MNRPGILVRVAGKPLIALLLLVGCGVVMYGWYSDHTVWWLGMLAAGVALRTLSAVGTVRRYKSWQAEWEAMGRLDEPARKAKKRGWKLFTVSVLLLLAIPASTLPQIQDAITAYLLPLQNYQQLVTVLHGAQAFAFFYLMFLVMRGCKRWIVKKVGQRKRRRQEKAEAAPASWLLEPASSAPSRADAQKNLPEYCSRLIGRN